MSQRTTPGSGWSHGVHGGSASRDGERLSGGGVKTVLPASTGGSPSGRRSPVSRSLHAPV